MINERNRPSDHGKETHLLGSDNGGPFEIWFYQQALQAQDWIRSNDTSMPFVYGLNDVLIDGFKKTADHIIMDKLDFEYSKNLTLEQQTSINANFLLWRHLHAK